MTDAEFIFREDSREKKTIGHSAAKRVGRRKGCKFPSDYKTRKELNAMNSVVKTYDLSQPMKWKEFKSLPEDLRKRYLIRLRDLYHAGPGAIAKMFGVTSTSVRNMSKLLGVSYPNACRPTPDARAAIVASAAVVGRRWTEYEFYAYCEVSPA